MGGTKGTEKKGRKANGSGSDRRTVRLVGGATTMHLSVCRSEGRAHTRGADDDEVKEKQTVVEAGEEMERVRRRRVVISRICDWEGEREAGGRSTRWRPVDARSRVGKTG